MNEARLETARLILRPRTIADLNANLAMDLNPAVHRYIYPSPPDPETQRRRLGSQIVEGWPAKGGLWVVEEKAAPGFLGWCALVPLEKSGFIEIGYRYLPAAWGRGIATEAARRVLDHGFRVLGFDPIVAVTNPANAASQNVLGKIGLKRDGMAFHYGQDVAFFRLGAAEFLETVD
jgi:RimJ/RimL family protein N-acetyltransferase